MQQYLQYHTFVLSMRSSTSAYSFHLFVLEFASSFSPISSSLVTFIVYRQGVCKWNFVDVTTLHCCGVKLHWLFLIWTLEPCIGEDQPFLLALEFVPLPTPNFLQLNCQPPLSFLLVFFLYLWTEKHGLLCLILIHKLEQCNSKLTGLSYYYSLKAIWSLKNVLKQIKFNELSVSVTTLM